ncbi:MAG: hypothetical protein ACTSQ8_26445 [Candidatus Helarchaeota archaeon]
MSTFLDEYNCIKKQTENLDLPIIFFLMFSRFEYALKRAGFTYDKSADANWYKFCSKYKDVFSLDKPPGKLIQGSYLLEDPPKKQILVGKIIRWKITEAPKEPVIFTFSRYARRVRNNLFHGEKFQMILENNSERNIKLVQSSLDVIRVFLDIDGDVRDFFYRGLGNL